MIGARYRLVPRVAALSILLLLMASVCFGIVLPLLSGLQGNDEDLDSSLRLLTGYQRVAALQPGLEQRLAKLNQEEASLPGLWPGATSALASAGLQSEVKRLVESAGGQIRSAQQLPAAQEGGFERIGLRLDLTVPMTALPVLLQALDAHAPYLFLDQIDLHAPETPAKAAPSLAIRWEVSGYHAGKPA
ncbi:MAG: type II secretion system protein GspM [Aliidongia sp.]